MADDDENLEEARASYPRFGSAEGTDVVFLGQSKDGWRDAYHYLLTMPLWRFMSVMASAFLGLNGLFALAYLATGGIHNAKPGSFFDAFFFSVQTLGTLGYGVMAPDNLAANMVVTLETFIGLFNLAIATGLMFARISRPTARVMFSDKAVVTTFDGAPTLMLRAANRRRNRIVEAEVSLSLMVDVTTTEGHWIRRFIDLPTVRARSPIFYLTWQIMHRIDEASPLFGETGQGLQTKGAQLIVVLKGLDETFAQTIHARTTYMPDEIIWGRRLADIFSTAPDGRRVIDYTHFHNIV